MQSWTGKDAVSLPVSPGRQLECCAFQSIAPERRQPSAGSVCAGNTLPLAAGARLGFVHGQTCHVSHCWKTWSFPSVTCRANGKAKPNQGCARGAALCQGPGAHPDRAMGDLLWSTPLTPRASRNTHRNYGSHKYLLLGSLGPKAYLRSLWQQISVTFESYSIHNNTILCIWT